MACNLTGKKSSDDGKSLFAKRDDYLVVPEKVDI
jgi:hypothetical protein